jgi:hypothetical protein
MFEVEKEIPDIPMANIKIPLDSIEPLFNALSILRPNVCTRLENKAIGLLKSSLYFELEKIMETEEEREERAINFKRLFEEQRKKQMREHLERERESVGS